MPHRTVSGPAPLAVAGAVAAATLVSSGCVAEPSLAQQSSASTVAELVGSGCSTSVVLGLARQIADEIDCSNPGQLVPFEAGGNITFASSAVLPYLQAGALADLRQVATTHSVKINSAFRTLPQQYLLYRWYLEGRCGITSAARVGSSNHETARAVDLTAYPLDQLLASGWSHDIPADDPHFNHYGSSDLRGADTLAFQRLWNRNHPEDPIAEDGLYGQQTEARLRVSPATGFAQGANCQPPVTGERIASVVSIDTADRAPPSTRVHVSLALANDGAREWSSATRIVVPDGQSLLHDASWLADDEITTLATTVAPGELAWLDFDLTTPAVTTNTIVSERLVLEDDGARFGSIELALTVVPGASAPTSGEGSEPVGGDGDDGGDDRYAAQDISGGCTTGRGSSLGGLVVLGGLVARRRRRPRR